MSTRPTFIIVGAGLAGAKAAETLRAEGFDGRLLLLGEEAERPYERPPLSKAYLRGETGRDSLYVHQDGFYAAHDIELRPSTRVRSIDPAARELELASGERIGYQRLLLATGAAPRRLPLPGAELDGVQYLRTRSDADTLAAAVARAEQVVVVGTGWIGSEAAASIRQLGREVALIGPDTAPLAKVLGPEVAGIYRDLHADHGVRLVLGTRIAAFRGTGQVEAVVIDDGRTIDCDLVLVGAGAVPRTELAEAAGLPVGNGVLVNEELEAVGAAGIYAAGDVAAAWHPRYQSYLRVEHWANALNQAPPRPGTCSASPPPTRGSPTSTPTSTTWAWSTRGSRPPGTGWSSGATRPRARSSPSGSRTSGSSPA
jgi:3-phenylpropionate/trans-cinnamate dioxygenase ferredoxin reductase component